MSVCRGDCRKQCVFAVGTEGNGVCVLWVLMGTVTVCSGNCREQCLCAVGKVGNSGCVLLLRY